MTALQVLQVLPGSTRPPPVSTICAVFCRAIATPSRSCYVCGNQTRLELRCAYTICAVCFVLCMSSERRLQVSTCGLSIAFDERPSSQNPDCHLNACILRPPLSHDPCHRRSANFWRRGEQQRLARVHRRASGAQREAFRFEPLIPTELACHRTRTMRRIFGKTRGIRVCSGSGLMGLANHRRHQENAR